MEKITPNDIKLFFMWVLHKLNIKHNWITISHHDKDTNSEKLK